MGRSEELRMVVKYADHKEVVKLHNNPSVPPPAFEFPPELAIDLMLVADFLDI